MFALRGGDPDLLDQEGPRLPLVQFGAAVHPFELLFRDVPGGVHGPSTLLPGSLQPFGQLRLRGLDGGRLLVEDEVRPQRVNDLFHHRAAAEDLHHGIELVVADLRHGDDRIRAEGRHRIERRIFTPQPHKELRFQVIRFRQQEGRQSGSPHDS